MNFSKTAGQVYLIRSKDGHYKIGHTRRSVNNRLHALQYASCVELTVYHIFNALNSYEVEQDLLNRFSDKNIRGEWFDLNKEDLAIFLDYAEVYENQYQTVKKYLEGGSNEQ